VIVYVALAAGETNANLVDRCLTEDFVALAGEPADRHQTAATPHQAACCADSRYSRLRRYLKSPALQVKGNFFICIDGLP
jgi:hypothetical protein